MEKQRKLSEKKDAKEQKLRAQEEKKKQKAADKQAKEEAKRIEKEEKKAAKAAEKAAAKAAATNKKKTVSVEDKKMENQGGVLLLMPCLAQIPLPQAHRNEVPVSLLPPRDRRTWSKGEGSGLLLQTKGLRLAARRVARKRGRVWMQRKMHCSKRLQKHTSS